MAKREKIKYQEEKTRIWECPLCGWVNETDIQHYKYKGHPICEECGTKFNWGKKEK